VKEAAGYPRFFIFLLMRIHLRLGHPQPDPTSLPS
jgi:hypothetical protein